MLLWWLILSQDEEFSETEDTEPEDMDKDIDVINEKEDVEALGGDEASKNINVDSTVVDKQV